MREIPTGADLLTAARQILREELLPLLPLDQRYPALMVANAMAIAAREVELGESHEAEELKGLIDLLGTAADPGGDDRTARLIALNRRLARLIRDGRYDPGTPDHEAAAAHLMAVARGRVRISNPKALSGPEERSKE